LYPIAFGAIEVHKQWLMDCTLKGRKAAATLNGQITDPSEILAKLEEVSS